MQLRILGPLEAECDGRLLELGRRKQRLLLAVLVLNANRVVSVSDLIEALWSGAPPADAAAGLQVQVSRLRRALACPRAGDEDRIQTCRPGYLVRVTAEEVDAHRFERLAAEGRQAVAAGRHVEAAERLDTALSLWRGLPLAELPRTRFVGPAIRRLEELRLTLAEELVEARLALGQHHQLIAQLAALVAEHPLRERRWGALMLALYRAGRQAEALRAYQELFGLLGAEVGIEPSCHLKRLEHEILVQAPALEWHNAWSAPSQTG